MKTVRFKCTSCNAECSATPVRGGFPSSLSHPEPQCKQWMRALRGALGAHYPMPRNARMAMLR